MIKGRDNPTFFCMKIPNREREIVLVILPLLLCIKPMTFSVLAYTISALHTPRSIFVTNHFIVHLTKLHLEHL